MVAGRAHDLRTAGGAGRLIRLRPSALAIPRWIVASNHLVLRLPAFLASYNDNDSDSDSDNGLGEELLV